MLTVSAALERAAAGAITAGSIVAESDAWHIKVLDAGRWRAICLARERFRTRKFASLEIAVDTLASFGLTECRIEFQRRREKQLELESV